VGLIRKTMSMGTFGLVDFRSDKERTARYIRHTRNAVRAQSQMQAQLAQQEAEAAYRQAALAQQQMNFAAAQLAVTQNPPVQPQAVAAGWYRNPAGDPARLQWWDGYAWTENYQPVPLPPPGT
jgi:hypothetical protein